MSSDSESVAFRAGGLSTIAILRPVLALGILAWGANLALSIWIAPTAAANLAVLTRSIGVRQIGMVLQPRVFNEEMDNRVLYVQDISADGEEWRGILLAELENPDETKVTFAQSGRINCTSEVNKCEVTLSNGSVHVVSDAFERTNFGTITLSIPIPTEPSEAVESTPLQIPTRQLWNGARTGTATYAEQVELHRRLALPFACLAFALIGFPLGLSTHRGGRSMGLVISALLMLVYYMVFIGGTRIAGNAQMSPFLGAWGANLGFALLGLILLLRSERERRNRVLDVLMDSGEWLRNGSDPMTSHGNSSGVGRHRDITPRCYEPSTCTC